MQTTTKRFYLARAAMTLFLAMLSLVVSAQSFVVVDKNGNRITFDVSKLDSVTFQQDPPALALVKVMILVQEMIQVRDRVTTLVKVRAILWSQLLRK